MSFSQNDDWVTAPKGEEREQLAEQLRQRDELQRANERVPTFERKAAPLPQVTMRSSDVDNVSLPAPSSATFYSKNGFTHRSGANVGPDDTVEIEIPGMGRQKTSVANALNMGLIMRDAAGGYRGLDAGERGDVNAQNEQRQVQEQAEAAAELETMRASGDAPDAATERLLAAVARAVPSQAVEQLSYDLVLNGSMSEAALARASEASGISLESGKRVALDMIDGLSRQAAAAVVSERVPATMVDEFYNWAAAEYPGEHKGAVMSVALGRDTGPLKDLARRFYHARVIRQS